MLCYGGDVGDHLMKDDELEQSLKQLGDSTNDNNEETKDVKPKPRIAPYDVTSGLAMLPKVSALLWTC